MRRLAAAAMAAVVALGVAGCAARTQTVELDGCVFEAPAGEIEKISDGYFTIVLEEAATPDDKSARLSWYYSDLSGYENLEVSDMLDPEKVEGAERYGTSERVNFRVESGMIGMYDTLKYESIVYYDKYAGGTSRNYLYRYAVQVHDDAYVGFELGAPDEATLDKYRDVADAVFDSVKLV